jgi:sigma-B regulation protein RsbU (phosphoserine phosphatase)
MKSLSESRVLIVDDTKSNIDALVQVLQGDYRLSVALSGEAALRAVEKSPPDLIMLDVMMPGIDGFEVCRLLREKPAYRDIPIMFLTGLQDVENKARGFEVGGNDYLTKPFAALEVKARVKAHLTAKAYSDSVKEKIASEMRIARDIQAGILECDICRELKDTGLEISARLEPAREVGGDLFVVLRNADQVMVVVGDVSGKGVPAAIFMAVTTTLLRTVGRLLHKPEVILRHVNDELANQNPHGMFVTLACAVLEPARGKISYASAGHPSPVLLRPGQPPAYPFDATGMMAGIMVDNEITAIETDLLAGDTYLFYSDGVTEAFNTEGGMFGEKRLLEAAGRGASLPVAELVQTVFQAVADFAGDHPQSDDITLLAVRSPG